MRAWFCALWKNGEFQTKMPKGNVLECHFVVQVLCTPYLSVCSVGVSFSALLSWGTFL